MQVTTVLTEHKPQPVNGRNGTFTIHKFKGQDGLWYETSKQDLANAAYALLESGAAALITFDPETKGNYTNNKISAVQAAGVGAPMAPAAPTGGAPTGAASNGGSTPPTSYRNESSPNEAGRIARSVAVEHLPAYLAAGVFEVPKSLDELADELAVLAKYIFNGSRPGAATQAPSPPAQGGGEQGAPQAAPAEVQAPTAPQAPETPQAPTAPAAAPATPDDDIPF